jgi:DNA invertase Pin-like site-specific DNA recombinase/transcription elongation factor Elf1
MLGIYCRTSRDDGQSIEQQKAAGLQFALDNNLEYIVYIDEGISGFKISEDDQNPCKGRPAFTALLTNVKNKKIDKVWVYEHSRLSRNQYASAYIFNIFEKNNVQIFENNKLIDLRDPQYQFLRQIMDAVSQLERNMIVNRTTRGLHHAINSGKRGFARFYGYKTSTKDKNGSSIWEPVENELNEIKFMCDEFLKGKTIRSIAFELYNKNKDNPSKLIKYANRAGQFIKHCEYTGYTLTMIGREILKKYENLEIDNIEILKDNQYWIKSIPYPIEVISREDWFKIIEKLNINLKISRINRNKFKRTTDKAIATGLITCGCCGINYFFYSQTLNQKTYYYYKHHNEIHKGKCTQSPKTIPANKCNELLKTFFFYYYIIYNQETNIIKDSMENIKNEIITLKMKIYDNELNIKNNKNQLDRLNKFLKNEDDKEVYRLTAKNIIKTEKEILDDTGTLASMKIKLEQLNIKYSDTELKNAFINIKEKIFNFFNTMNNEKQRNELRLIIKNCYIFGNILLIENHISVFLFRLERNDYPLFDTSLVDKLRDNENFKCYFMNKEEIQNNILNDNISTFNDSPITKFSVKNDIDFINDIFNKINIKYDIESKQEILFFFDVREYLS